MASGTSYRHRARSETTAERSLFGRGWHAEIPSVTPYRSTPCSNCGQPIGNRHGGAIYCLSCAIEAGIPQNQREGELALANDRLQRENRALKLLLVAGPNPPERCGMCERPFDLADLDAWTPNGTVWVHNCAATVIAQVNAQ